MKKIVLFTLLSSLSIPAFANLDNMMKIYHNPQLAPKVKACKNNIKCNAFMALSRQWQSIPNHYRYKGKWEIKSFARKGITWDNQGRNIGLWKGFYWTEKSVDYFDAALNHLAEPEPHIERGLAVLLYIEDKNGWAPDYGQ